MEDSIFLNRLKTNIVKAELRMLMMSEGALRCRTILSFTFEYVNKRPIDMAVMVQMISAAFLVVLLVIMELATMTLASPASVNIYNLFEGSAESVHMTCGAFGDKAIRYGEHFGWGFSYSVTGKTRWSCAFRWGSKIQYFLVWYDERSETTPHQPYRMCIHCLWLVKAEGFYLKSGYGFEAPVMYFSWYFSSHSPGVK